MGRARLALPFCSLIAALLAVAGCGGGSSGATSSSLGACGRDAELASLKATDLASAVNVLRFAARADRELALELPPDRAGPAQAAYADAARTLGSLQLVDPQSMTPLRAGVESSRRELARARALLKEACG